MKRLISILLCLMFVGSAIAAQKDETAATKKTKAAPVDCSTVDDSTITTNVQEKISKAKSLKDFTINVASSAGVVTLTGSVKTGLNKGTATRVAKSVACVKKVENQLTVETSGKSAAKSKTGGR